MNKQERAFLIKHHDNIYHKAIIDFIDGMLDLEYIPNRATLKSIQKALKKKLT